MLYEMLFVGTLQDCEINMTGNEKQKYKLNVFILSVSLSEVNKNA